MVLHSWTPHRDQGGDARLIQDMGILRSNTDSICFYIMRLEFVFVDINRVMHRRSSYMS